MSIQLLARPTARALLLAAALATPLARPAAAQTDYYNTDAGRPIATEDAYPVERRALELQLAPLRLERNRGGVYSWGLEPEVAFGILPRTQIEAGLPLLLIDGPAGRRTGIAGLELSLLHNLNVETSIPALALVGDVLLPIGALGPDRTYASLKGIATKTFTWARFHVNGGYTFGDAPPVPRAGATEMAETMEVSRWMGALAVDRTLPLRSTLLTAELVARQPLHADEAIEWTLGTGTRYQYSPRWALDFGVGRRVRGAEQPWYVTFGSAYALGLPWSAR